MEDYEILIDTGFGQVKLNIQADNYDSASEFAHCMNQGDVNINLIEDVPLIME